MDCILDGVGKQVHGREGGVGRESWRADDDTGVGKGRGRLVAGWLGCRMARVPVGALTRAAAGPCG